ncbi:hypothetical protein DRO97_06455 [Archaeoglobales archaeon]|nr:MAG: hypothetical protein DRO97_06455 [Archaeoglobales archaeon]
MPSGVSFQALVSVFVIGLIGGVSLAISIIVGISPDPLGITEYVLENICEITEKMDGGKYFDVGGYCSMYLNLIRILSMFVSIITILGAIKTTSDWRAGLIIYVIGYVLGFLYIYLNV